MLDLRSPLTWAVAPAGLAVGLAAWLAFGAEAAGLGRLEAAEQRLAAESAELRPARSADGRAAGRAALTPLFASDAMRPEPVLELHGLSRTPRRQAALLSVDGGAPVWVARGAATGPVTVVEVRATTVVLETVGGRKEIGFWSKPPASAGSAAAAGGDLPAGLRLPPPPASAPGVS